MVSISSSNLIRQCTLEFCKRIKSWKIDKNNLLLNKMNLFLKNEYNIIPENERIGKGSSYISTYVSKEIMNYLKKIINIDKEYYIELSEKAFK